MDLPRPSTHPFPQHLFPAPPLHVLVDLSQEHALQGVELSRHLLCEVFQVCRLNDFKALFRNGERTKALKVSLQLISFTKPFCLRATPSQLLSLSHGPLGQARPELALPPPL